MNEINIDPEVDKIDDRFNSVGIVLDRGTVKLALERLIAYRVPVPEAVRTVTTQFRKKYDIAFENMRGGESPLTRIADVHGDNHWVTIRGKVVKVWEPNSEVISQTGLIGDDSGIIKYTIFAKSQAKVGLFLELDKSYEFKNVVSSEWQGQTSIKINASSKITPLTEEIKAERQKVTVAGVITQILLGSGLIKRCPECGRKLSKGSCGEHGKVDGIFDLRVKACLMDSVPSDPPKGYELIISRELVEQITGLTLDRAKEMATEALDQAAVLPAIAPKFLFGHFKVTGVQLPGNFLVESMEPVNGIAVNLAKEVKKLVAPLAGIDFSKLNASQEAKQHGAV